MKLLEVSRRVRVEAEPSGGKKPKKTQKKKGDLHLPPADRSRLPDLLVRVELSMRCHFRALAATLAAVFLTSAASGTRANPLRPHAGHFPDGKSIAFSYLGDIWTVEAIGGVARPVTMHEAHDINPIFSPDGKQIAFSSNRYGSYDVFVVSAVGGKPQRLTFDSAPDMVTGWTPDGKGVVFSSPHDCVSVEHRMLRRAGRRRRGEETAAVRSEGSSLLHPAATRSRSSAARGTWYRRGYRGSSNDDIWVSTADGKDTRRVTTFDGQDGVPMFSPDARKLFYVTENGSKPNCANIVCQNLASDGSPVGTIKRFTMHDDGTVRRARIERNGEWIVYELGADLWVVERGATFRRASSPSK